MKYPSDRTILFLFLVVLAGAVGLRTNTAFRINEVLPLSGLYVDEMTYSMSPFPSGSHVFGKPPAMFVLTHFLGAGENALILKVFLSLLSMLSAVLLLLSFRDFRKNLWLMFCSAALLLDPFFTFFGLQVAPAVPAALFLAASLMIQSRFRSAFVSGILAGIAVLFRGEVILAIPFILLLSVFRSKYRLKALIWCGGALAVITPILVFNAVGGGGAVIASNGAENLWIGTDWNLLTVPPGVEFEELVSVSTVEGHDAEFFSRAFDSVSQSPIDWMLMGFRKIGAFFSLPGPGRNMETGWLLRISGLLFLLPVSLLALGMGLARSFKPPENSFRGIIASSVVFAGITAAFIFFPSARSRTAFLPGFFFLTAFCPVRLKELKFIIPSLLLILCLSLFHRYPGEVRPGLTYVLSAEQSLNTGMYDDCFNRLELAEERGFSGADLHNIRGAALSEIKYLYPGLLEFELALEIAVNSPTLWRNYAVSLWNLGQYLKAHEAAARAVELNPLLAEQLAPILADYIPMR